MTEIETAPKLTERQQNLINTLENRLIRLGRVKSTLERLKTGRRTDKKFSVPNLDHTISTFEAEPVLVSVGKRGVFETVLDLKMEGLGEKANDIIIRDSKGDSKKVVR